MRKAQQLFPSVRIPARSFSLFCSDEMKGLLTLLRADLAKEPTLRRNHHSTIDRPDCQEFTRQLWDDTYMAKS